MNTTALPPTVPQRRWNWRLFWTLEIAGVLAVVALFPYALEMQGPLLKQHPLPIPLAALVPIQIVQNAILIGGFIALGMLLAPKVGLGAPLLSAWTSGQPAAPRLRATLPLSTLWGVMAAVLVVILDTRIFATHLPHIAGPEAASPAAWKAFLASFYGGIDEEILLRYGIMTLLVFIFGKIFRDAPSRPASAAFWAANLLAAVLFGLGHLPATAMLMPLTKVVVLRAVLLNGIPGVIFGFLYWKRGLESAMLSHFAADLVLHVVAPLFLGR
ncbi:MAG TPA: CPBP family intramembrane glutamic endopeptidase [Terriglobales bacterium]|nr:CPBP family intramembrane glutamic endopeptidase [Terriglobales bacterium]